MDSQTYLCGSVPFRYCRIRAVCGRFQQHCNDTSRNTDENGPALKGTDKPTALLGHLRGRHVARRMAVLIGAAFMATGCGGTTTDATSTSTPPTTDPWTAVTAAILAAQGWFSGGLAVEVLTPAGVVYSRNVGGFTTAIYAPVASASKMVSASVFLRLIEQGHHDHVVRRSGAQLRQPIAHGVLSTYGGAANPNPAGALACTSVEYARFLMMQLRQGLDGGNRFLTAATIRQLRADAFGPATTIAFSA